MDENEGMILVVGMIIIGVLTAIIVAFSIINLVFSRL